MDIEAIVRRKAEDAFTILQRLLLVDAVGLYIDAWNGFPGPFNKYLMESGGNDLFLRMLKHEKKRSVTARAAIGFHNGSEVHTFIGEVKGSVATEKCGDYAFGWDPIIIPEGQTRTFGEMSPEEKNAISHRRKALDKLKLFFIQHQLFRG